LVSHNPSFIWMVLNWSHGGYLTPTSWLGLDGYLMPTDWWMTHELTIFFQFAPFRAIVSVLLIDLSVCLTGIRRSRPIWVAHAWITTLVVKTYGYRERESPHSGECVHVRNTFLQLTVLHVSWAFKY
jgi:hypothetical protein